MMSWMILLAEGKTETGTRGETKVARNLRIALPGIAGLVSDSTIPDLDDIDF